MSETEMGPSAIAASDGNQWDELEPLLEYFGDRVESVEIAYCVEGVTIKSKIALRNGGVS